MMTTGGDGADRSVGHSANPPSPSFRLAKAFRRRFRLSRPTTWPTWFWWLVTALWCAIVAVLGAWLTVLSNPGYGFWRMFAGTFACAMLVNVAIMTWNSYQRRRRDKS
jgi:4-hydroxybenzoate polyprenyltransferase